MVKIRHVMLAASSPNEKGGLFTDLIFAKDRNGVPLMNSVIFGDPCAACKAGPHPELCDHKLDELSAWKHPQKVERMRELYTAVGAEATFRAEVCTMTRQNVSTIFPPGMREGFLGGQPKPADPYNDKISAVYVGVDPAYGGKCDFALVALGQVANRKEFQVLMCFAEQLVAGNDQVRAMAAAAVDRLLAHPRVGRGVPIVVALEGDSEASMYLADMFRYRKDVLCLKECSSGNRFGVPKTPSSTRDMVTLTQALLTLHILTFPIDAIPLSTVYVEREKSINDFRKMFALQMSNFRLSRDGKYTGKEGGGNDDLIVALMTAVLWMTLFAQNEDNEYYLAFKNCYGKGIWTDATPRAILRLADPDGASEEEEKNNRKRPAAGGAGGEPREKRRRVASDAESSRKRGADEMATFGQPPNKRANVQR